MGGSKLLAPLLAVLAASSVGISPAAGQCRLCETPTTALSQSASGDGIGLEIETSLNFGRLILAGEGQGAAVIRPDGSNAAEGALASVSARAMVGTAVVHGTAGRAIRVELPSRIELYSLSGGKITLDNVVSDLPALPRLDSAGNLTFRFGGRVTVTGDSEGDYRGSMPITVEYQ
jgi:type 1 fimbria pilin